MQIHSFMLRTGFSFSVARLSRYFSLSLLLAWLVCSFNSLSAQGSDQAGPLPPLHLERVRSLDVQHIALDLRFDWDKKQAFGTATITLAPLAAADHIALDAGMLSIQSIQLADQTPLQFEYDGGDQNDGLKIALNRKYAAGETLQLVIQYHTLYQNESDPNNLWGSYGKGLRFFQPSATEPRKRRQIWSMGEPSGNRYWFPCYDAPNDFRTTALKGTVDGNLTLISNGKLVENKQNPDGTRSFHWKMDTPHANHQTSLVVGEYLDYAQTVDGVELHSFAYPDELEATKATIVRLPEMLRFFTEFTGQKYPYPAYNQVFVQDFPWGGGHNIGVSTISENMVDDYGTHADFFYLWDGVEAQDLAAQWFANLLTPSDWEHAWLSKSFFLYMDCLFTEYKNGRDEMLLWNRQFQHNTYLGDWNNGIRRPVVTKNYDDPTTMTQDNYALRGALVLHLLRKHLGEEKWRKAIQFYVSQNAASGGKGVTTEKFIQAVETSSGEKLDWFFDQWIYKMGHPTFEVSKNYDPVLKKLTIKVLQTQKPDPGNAYPQAEFFKGKLLLEIDERIVPVWLEAKAAQEWVFDVPRAPRLVHFDVESAWIKTLKFEKTAEELLYQFQHSQDILGRRSAMLELSKVFGQEKTSAEGKAKIQGAFQQVITGQSYWRFRYSAILTLQGMLAGKPLDKSTISMLLQRIKREKSWNRAAAISFLGDSRDPKFAGLYRKYFADESDRVVNAAAIALGKSKHPEAYESLILLKDKPSWKNQSLISSLNGLKVLGDPRGAELALSSLKDASAAPRWTLATSTWDFRLAAAETLVALGKGNEG